MAVETWDNDVYLICRAIAWLLVWCASLFDFIKHKGEKVHGWQLHRCIFVVLCLEVIKDILGLIWQFAFTDGTPASTYFFYVLTFFYDLADASFLCLLMVISYGWKITRNHFADEWQPIFVAPIVNFVAIVIHDFIWEKAGGHHGACYIRLKNVESDIMLIATLTYLFTIIYIWMWIFQAVKIEKLKLEEKMYHGKLESLQQDADPLGDDRAVTPAGYTASTSNAVMEGESDEGADIVGASAATTAAADLDLKTPDTNYSDSIAEEDDTAMPLLSKYRMLLFFFNAVSAYFTAICAVIVVQVWTTKCEFTEGGYTIAVNAWRIAMLCIRDFIYIIFLAALAYVFRLRERNPYFMLDDYNTNLFDDDEEEGTVAVGMHSISTSE